MVTPLLSGGISYLDQAAGPQSETINDPYVPIGNGYLGGQGGTAAYAGGSIATTVPIRSQPAPWLEAPAPNAPYSPQWGNFLAPNVIAQLPPGMQAPGGMQSETDMSMPGLEGDYQAAQQGFQSPAPGVVEGEGSQGREVEGANAPMGPMMSPDGREPWSQQLQRRIGSLEQQMAAQSQQYQQALMQYNQLAQPPASDYPLPVRNAYQARQGAPFTLGQRLQRGLYNILPSQQRQDLNRYGIAADRADEINKQHRTFGPMELAALRSEYQALATQRNELQREMFEVLKADYKAQQGALGKKVTPYQLAQIAKEAASWPEYTEDQRKQKKNWLEATGKAIDLPAIAKDRADSPDGMMGYYNPAKAVQYDERVQYDKILRATTQDKIDSSHAHAAIAKATASKIDLLLGASLQGKLLANQRAKLALDIDKEFKKPLVLLHQQLTQAQLANAQKTPDYHEFMALMREQNSDAMDFKNWLGALTKEQKEAADQVIFQKTGKHAWEGLSPMAKSRMGRINDLVAGMVDSTVTQAPKAATEQAPPPPPTSPSLVDGQYGAGNIDLTKRPVVRNADGSISTVRSMSFREDGKEVLIPTVVNGKVVSDKEAMDHYHRTGQYLGKFDSVAAANSYAQALHQAQAREYGGQSTGSYPPAGAAQAPAAQKVLTGPVLQHALDSIAGTRKPTKAQWQQKVLPELERQGYSTATLRQELKF